jgi:predicted dehydrogenase
MKVVVAGTGFGARVHVPALRAAGFEVDTLVGRDAERTARRAARLGIPNADTSLARALARRGVDAVTIATPPDTHAPLVAEALDAERHVLCEKPFTLDEAEARELRVGADRAGLVALVGHEFRFAPDRALVARLIRDGAIGAPQLAIVVQQVSLVADPATRLPAWWFDPERGGGWLGASGSHVVDQIRHWLGEIVRVDAALPTVTSRPDAAAEDSFAVLGRLASGATAVLAQTAGAWGASAGVTSVAGTDGTLHLSGGDVVLAHAGDPEGSVVPVPADLSVTLLGAPSSARDEPRHRFTHLELGPYTRLCSVFAAAIREGDTAVATEAGAASFADGEACMRVLDAIRHAAAAG